MLKKDSSNILKGYHCEIRLIIKGNNLFARSKANNFEQASTFVIESLRRQLMRIKTKKRIQRRKGKLVFRGA